MVDILGIENGRSSGKPGSLFPVIPDMCYQESLLILFRMDSRYQPAR